MNLSEIVSNGYCIGCGLCAASAGGKVSMKFDDFGQYQASLSEENKLENHEENLALKICPFSDEGPNEDELARDLFQNKCSVDTRVGFHSGLYVGHVVESNFREIATSGGIITWIASRLLQTGLVDYVVHVKKSDEESTVLFEYGISRTVEEVKAGAKSRYYPIEMSEVLSVVRSTPGKCVVIGIPCFVKGIRRLALVDPIVKDRVAYTIGLVCGHLKSKAFADMFGWQAGIEPGKIKEVDFRVKMPLGNANKYGTKVRGDGIEQTKRVDEYFGWNWKYNLFRYSACDYCDDVFSETADISVGDAWISEYAKDPKGNSVVVVRDNEIHKLIIEGIGSGSLNLEATSVDKIAQSQAGGLRDRREGLSYRLLLDDQKGRVRPQKRVEASDKGLNFWRKKIYQCRVRLRTESHKGWNEAVKEEDFELFKKRMMPLMKLNDFYYRVSLKEIVRLLKSAIRRSITVSRLKPLLKVGLKRLRSAGNR